MATTAEKIARLKRLIGITHQHGIKLEGEIRALRAHKPRGWLRQVAAKRSLLAGLKVLNFKRRVELARLEHKPVPKPPPPPPKPKPRFSMYDSTNVGNIPADAKAVAGYINGDFANYVAMVRRFPHAKHLSISVNATGRARCLDVETGDATPEQAPGWFFNHADKSEGKPIFYANSSTMPLVIAALDRAGIKRDEYEVWTAHYTNVPHIEPGSDATQYEDHRELWDISLCEPWFLS